MPFAHSEYTAQLTALFEAVDPHRVHRFDINKCYAMYYELWKEEKPFSGAHFLNGCILVMVDMPWIHIHVASLHS